MVRSLVMDTDRSLCEVPLHIEPEPFTTPELPNRQVVHLYDLSGSFLRW